MGQIRVKPHIRQGRPVKGHVRKHDARPRFREGATFHWRDYTDTRGDLVRVFVEIDEYDGDKAYLQLVYQTGAKRQTGRRYTVPRASVPLHVNDLQGNVSDVTKLSGDPAIDAVIKGNAELAGKGNDGVVYLVGDEAVKVGTTTPYQPENSSGHRTPAEAVAHSKREFKAHQALQDLDLVPEVRWAEHGGRGWLVKPRMVEVDDKDLTLAELERVSDTMHAIHARSLVLGDRIQLARGTADGKLYLMDLGQVRPIDANLHHNDKMGLERLWHDAGHQYGVAGPDAAEKALGMMPMVETALGMEAPDIVARWGAEYLDVVESAQSWLYDEDRDEEAWQLELLARRVRGAMNAQRDKLLRKAVDLGPAPEDNRDEYPYVGTIDWPGLPPILVETAAGTYREGKGWRVMLDHHYGEFEGTLGTDGDPVDVFVGPYNPDRASKAYVIHQKRPGTREFDEDKVMIGFRTREHAIRAYRQQYDRPGYFAGVSTWEIPALSEAMTGTWRGKALWRKTTLRADLAKGEQLALFGSQEVQVRPHVRRTKGGKVVPVKQHQAKRAKAKPKGPGPRPETREALWEWGPFKRWFGGSKVVDDKGDPEEQHGPIVVYHGTAVGGFQAFDPEKDKGSNLYGAGFYFTEDREVAESYMEKDAETSWLSATGWAKGGKQVHWLDRGQTKAVLEQAGFWMPDGWSQRIPWPSAPTDMGDFLRSVPIPGHEDPPRHMQWSSKGNNSPLVLYAAHHASDEKGRLHLPTFLELIANPREEDRAAWKAWASAPSESKYHVRRYPLEWGGSSPTWALKGLRKVMEGMGAEPVVPEPELKQVYLRIRHPLDMDASVTDDELGTLNGVLLDKERAQARLWLKQAEGYVEQARSDLELIKRKGWGEEGERNAARDIERAEESLEYARAHLKAKQSAERAGLDLLGIYSSDKPPKGVTGYDPKAGTVPFTRANLRALKEWASEGVDPDKPSQFLSWQKATAMNPGRLTWQDVYALISNGFRDRKALEPYLAAAGHDGIRHTGGWNIGTKRHTVWIAFEPTQVKATTSEAFDPSTPNMYKGVLVRRLLQKAEQLGLFGTRPVQVKPYTRKGKPVVGYTRAASADRPFQGSGTTGAPKAVVDAVVKALWEDEAEGIDVVVPRPDGSKVQTRVELAKLRGDADVDVQGDTATVRVRGSYDPRSKRHYLHKDSERRAQWAAKRRLRQVIEHELAHVSDPGVKRHPPRDLPTFDAWANDPDEVVAQRHELYVAARGVLERWGREKVQQRLAVHGGDRTVKEVIGAASSSGQVGDGYFHMTTENRRKVLRTLGAAVAAFAAGETLAKATEQLTLPLVDVRAHVRRGKRGPIMVQRHIRRPTRRAVPSGDARPTQLVLYAGMGGDALGGMRAGTRVVGMIERDPHAVSTLRAAKSAGHLQGEVIAADLTDYDFKRWRGKVDILTGGPPCQPFSRAGNQAGPDDLRDGWPTVLRAVRDIAPRAVAMENVRGLMDRKYQGYRRVITDELARLGYHAEWRTLNAAEFGVPQKRERVWLVAWKDGTQPWTGPDTSLDEPTSAEAAWRARGFRDSSTADLKDPPPSARTAKWLRKHPPSVVGETLGAPGKGDPAYTQVARYGAGSVNLAWVPKVEQGARVLLDDSDDAGLARYTGRTLAEVEADPDASYIEDRQEWAEVMDANGVKWGRGLLIGRVTEDNGDTLTVEIPNHGTEVWPRHFAYGTELTVKRMPPEAMAAMQDFPEDYPIQGGDNARGRQAGNAIPPRLAQAVLAPFVGNLAPMRKGEQLGLFGQTHVRAYTRKGKPVQAYLRAKYAGKGAPKPGEKGHRPAPERRPGTPADTAARNIIDSAVMLYGDPEFAGILQTEAGDPDALWTADDVPDLLLVPRVVEGRQLTPDERSDIAHDALGLAAEVLPGRWVGGMDHLADPVMKGRGSRRHQLGWRMPRDEDLQIPEAIARAVLHDRLYQFATGDRGKMRLEAISLAEARQFVAKHHSALPAWENRGAMYAVGLKRGRRLAAVAIAGSPSGPWKDPHSVLELYRVASDGTTAFAASKLTARMIDLVEDSARPGAINPPKLVTYSLVGEPADVYKGLRNKGLRPVAIREGKTGKQGARGNVDDALGNVRKIRWEAGPGAGEARWDLVEAPPITTGPSPLKYPGGKPERIAIEGDGAPTDHRYSHGRQVAFLDYTPGPDGDVFINYMYVHQNERRKGHARRLVDAIYKRFPGEVDWGKVMSDGAEAMWREYKAKHGRTRGKLW